VQRGFHIIFAAAAVDSVRRNFCSSYVSLKEREVVIEWIEEGQKIFVCARAYVCMKRGVISTGEVFPLSSSVCPLAQEKKENE